MEHGDVTAICERAGDGGWWARALWLPVYAAGDTREEAERGLREAVALHRSVLERRARGLGPHSP